MKAHAKKSIQYTIRGVPYEVDQALRRRAKTRKISLNQLLIEELAAQAGVTEVKRRDVSKIAGKWTPDPAFDEIIASQRQIDWDRWK